MALIENLATLIGLTILLFIVKVYSQASEISHYQGVVILVRGSKIMSQQCKQCYFKSKTNKPVGFDNEEEYYICEINLKQASTVELTFRAPTNKIMFTHPNCTMKMGKDMKNEFWHNPLNTFKHSSKKPDCILITNLIIEEHTTVMRILFYYFIIITLIIGAMYMAYRNNLWIKLRNYWRLQQEEDHHPLT